MDRLSGTDTPGREPRAVDRAEAVGALNALLAQFPEAGAKEFPSAAVHGALLTALPSLGIVHTPRGLVGSLGNTRATEYAIRSLHGYAAGMNMSTDLMEVAGATLSRLCSILETDAEFRRYQASPDDQFAPAIRLQSLQRLEGIAGGSSLTLTAGHRDLYLDPKAVSEAEAIAKESLLARYVTEGTAGNDQHRVAQGLHVLRTDALIRSVHDTWMKNHPLGEMNPLRLCESVGLLAAALKGHVSLCYVPNASDAVETPEVGLMQEVHTKIDKALAEYVKAPSARYVTTDSRPHLGMKVQTDLGSLVTKLRHELSRDQVGSLLASVESNVIDEQVENMAIRIQGDDPSLARDSVELLVRALMSLYPEPPGSAQKRSYEQALGHRVALVAQEFHPS